MTKREKIYQMATKIHYINCLKKYVDQMAIYKIYQHLPLKDPPKYTIFYFWCENLPSGNSDSEARA
jgi:hypothetical protein